MRFFDLHCDTLYRCLKEDKGLYDNNFDISLKKGEDFDKWIECFAIWISDGLSDYEINKLFNDAANKLNLEIKENESNIYKCSKIDDLKDNESIKKCGAIFTVEGGCVLLNDVNRVDYLHKMGVKMITLTWNGKSDFGSGCLVDSPDGLTDFGKKALKRMNELGIYADVSHASDRLFFDVAQFINTPIIATHSNSRTICNHKRNLTDEQFKVIKESKGLVGINFCKDFLNPSGDASFIDIRKHIEHFLSLGGEDILCIGSDFDGADMPKDISSIKSVYDLYEYFLKCNYKETLVDKIFFNNAYNKFKNIILS